MQNNENFVDSLILSNDIYAYRSREIGKLFKSLGIAQTQFKPVVKDSNNPFFKSKYANLEIIMKQAQPILQQNGLEIAQLDLPFAVDPSILSELYLHTFLVHDESGQWIKSITPLKPKDTNIQSYGSCLSYLRRYQYVSITGIIVADEEDDDGEKAMGRDTKQVSNSGYITKEQEQIFHGEFKGYQEIYQDVLNYCKISTISAIPKDRFQVIFDTCQKKKKALDSVNK